MEKIDELNGGGWLKRAGAVIGAPVVLAFCGLLAACGDSGRISLLESQLSDAQSTASDAIFFLIITIMVAVIACVVVLIAGVGLGSQTRKQAESKKQGRRKGA